MIEPTPDVGLDRAALNRAFPFHFRLSPRSGSWGVVSEIGSSLGRIAPEARVGRLFEEAFAVERPREGLDREAGPDQATTYLLEPKGREDHLRLRGQFLRVGRLGRIVFIGAPWVGELDDLARFGLSLHDFPPHESLGDMLLILQTRNVALNDLRELNHRLAAAARQLNERHRRFVEEAERRRRLESRLRQVQVMEAIGQLAGGVARDCNDIMRAILGQTALALQSLPRDHPARAAIEEIQQATGRATALSTQLMTMSSRKAVEPKPVDLAEACREIEPLLRRLLGERIRLALPATVAAPRVEIDPDSLRQALLQLAANARDAMPEGGTFRLGVDPAAAGPSGRAGVLLEVRDDGAGMPPEVRERVFEPFFTTKPAGDATGLGLATVHGIVQQAGGEITVESESGHGTTFRLWFPARSDRAASSTDGSSRRTDRDAPKVLLVEDEPQVRALLTLALGAAGFTVRAASDPPAALAAAQESPTLDLLVADIGLPGMSGPELAEAIRHAHPALRTMYISGSPGEDALGGSPAGGRSDFLQKPFRPAELVDRLTELLEAEVLSTTEKR